MDVEETLAAIERLLAEARAVPLSSTVLVQRDQAVELAARVRDSLPEELRQARWVLKERDDLIAQARTQVDQILADGRAERERLAGQTEVVAEARRQAERIMSDERDAARTVRMEADDYIDGRLAALQVLLERTLDSVARGREHLGAGQADRQAGPTTQFFDYEAADA